MLTFVSEPLESQLSFAGTHIWSIGCSCRAVSHCLLCLVGHSGSNTRRGDSGGSDFIHFDLSYFVFFIES